MTEDVLKRTTVIAVDGTSIVQVGDFTDPVAPPPPPPPPTGDGYPVYADRQVTVNVGDHMQTKINANSAGTIYGFNQGVHLSAGALGLFTPKAGDKFVGTTDVAGVPTAFIKGNWNRTQTGTGLTSPFTGTLPSGVQMVRLDFSDYASATAQCAMNSGDSWTYWKCWIHHNKSGGVRLGISGLISGGKCHDNGQCGMFAHHPATGGIVDGVEIYNNNIQGWHPVDFEAGGVKFVAAQDLLTNITVRNCFAHHNGGPGLWWDQSGGGHLIEDNLCEDNALPGIKIEISNGVYTIRRNTCRRNGGGANIFINNVRGTNAGAPVVVEDNLCEFSTSHAEIWLEDAPFRSPRLGYVTVRNNVMRHAFTSGQVNVATGMFYAGGSDGVIPPSIVWSNNDYFVAPGVAWQWLGTARTWAQWQALGFDTTGSQQPL